jgi:hypothetical protein
MAENTEHNTIFHAANTFPTVLKLVIITVCILTMW